MRETRDGHYKKYWKCNGHQQSMDGPQQAKDELFQTGIHLIGV